MTPNEPVPSKTKFPGIFAAKDIETWLGAVIQTLLWDHSDCEQLLHSSGKSPNMLVWVKIMGSPFRMDG